MQLLITQSDKHPYVYSIDVVIPPGIEIPQPATQTANSLEESCKIQAKLFANPPFGIAPGPSSGPHTGDTGTQSQPPTPLPDRTKAKK